MLRTISFLQFTQALSYFTLTRSHKALVAEKRGQRCLHIFQSQARFTTTSEYVDTFLALGGSRWNWIQEVGTRTVAPMPTGGTRALPFARAHTLDSQKRGPLISISPEASASMLISCLCAIHDGRGKIII